MDFDDIWFSKFKLPSVDMTPRETRKYGMLHSFNDEPALISNDEKYLTMMWYDRGLMHRDMDRPSLVFTNRSGETCFYWTKDGHASRIGSLPDVVYYKNDRIRCGWRRTNIDKSDEVCKRIYGIVDNDMMFMDRVVSEMDYVNAVKIVRNRHNRDIAARIIQKWWTEIRLNPYHPVGIKRLNKEYDSYL
jgi:hypothetical protein